MSNEALLAVYTALEKKIAAIDVRQGGPMGPQGKTGPKGLKGDKGSEGKQGVQGKMGPTGPTGSKGSTGPQGPQGAAGAKGTKGDPGAKGEPGIGTQGPVGPQGDRGTDGISIIDLQCDMDGRFTAYFSDGTEVDVGTLHMPDGPQIVYSGGGGGSSGGGGTTPNHNALNGLQGGETSQYYHLTATEHSTLADWVLNGLPDSGVQTVVGGTANTVDSTDPANPVVNVDTFTGAGTTGVVPDPITSTNRFLADDGTFQDAPVSPIGGITISMVFNATATVPTTLPNGDVAVNNIDQTLATKLWVSDTTKPGAAIDFLWQQVEPGEYIGFWEAKGDNETDYYRILSKGVKTNDFWEFDVEFTAGTGGVDDDKLLQLFFIGNPASLIPGGGLTGQSLTKNSDTPYDDSWQNKVSSVVGGVGAEVDATDPFNLIVSSLLAESATQPGDNLSTLTNDEGFAPTVGALKHEVVTALPGTPDLTTIYYVTGP